MHDQPGDAGLASAGIATVLGRPKTLGKPSRALNRASWLDSRRARAGVEPVTTAVDMESGTTTKPGTVLPLQLHGLLADGDGGT